MAQTKILKRTPAKERRRIRVKKGLRKRIWGSTERPRLNVYRSNNAIYAQIINDETGETLVSHSSRVKDIDNHSGNKTDKAKLVGQAIAEKAQAVGVSKVVFDRNGYQYHGRVKALAEGAREGGLDF